MEDGLRFIPSRVDGLREVTQVAVFPDRLDLCLADKWLSFPFAEMAEWPHPAWFWQLLARLGYRQRYLMVGEADWFHPPADRFIRFFISPRVVVLYMPDEPEGTDFAETWFRRVHDVIIRGGFNTRFPLMPLPSLDPETLRTFEETGCDVKTEQAARRRLLALVGEDDSARDFDADLLADLAAACDVYSFLQSPTEYEIVQLAREPFSADFDCLGFDVGYWGGDHYSIICDSAVRPLWHPPQPECFDELARQLKMVNESFLFPNAEGAAQFRSWYRTQHWAETESRPDEFCIIQVNKPR